MHLSEIISQDHVLPSVRAQSKKQLLQELSTAAAKPAGLEPRRVFEALLQREKLGSTGLGQGIAIPHGRIKGIPEAIGAFVRTKSPIPFDSPDGRGVSVIFVLLVPEQATDRHLQILSELAQMFSDKAMREKLATASDPMALRQAIERWQGT